MSRHPALTYSSQSLRENWFKRYINDALDAPGSDKSTRMPWFVVLGDRASGKSSVLRNIVGLDFLPRGSYAATRRPLIIKLDNRPWASLPSSESTEKAEWGEFLHAPDKRFYSFEKIRHEIIRETEDKAGRNAGISEEPITLRISSPSFPTMTLVDLPGLASIPIGDQATDIEAKLRNLALKYISPPNVTILVVVAANSGPASSDALTLATQVDPGGKRSVGLLTKIDLMDQGTDVVDILAGRVVPLRLGWVPLAHQGQRYGEDQWTISATLDAEKAFFENHEAYRRNLEYCGIPYIERKMALILMMHAKQVLGREPHTESHRGNETPIPSRKNTEATKTLRPASPDEHRLRVHRNESQTSLSPARHAGESRSAAGRPKSPSASRHISDLIRDSRLETVFSKDAVQHISYVSNSRIHQRRVRKETWWTRRRKLGEGAFGRVWLEECVDGQECGELRAVKEISRAVDGHAPVDYERELEAIAKFSHPNYVHCFVRSFGWYESESSIFIAMEYVEGGDLQRYVGRPFPEVEVRDIISQVLEGLSFMHDNGFAHRDLKPSNILVLQPSPKWWVKLSDFGISKRAQEETALRTAIGTIGYMAPEVLGIGGPGSAGGAKDADLSYTDAVDIWALGAIAYRLLTNSNPFPAVRTLIEYVMSNKHLPAGDLDDAGATPACQRFLASVMAASPPRRPSASEALKDPWMSQTKFPAHKPPLASFSSLSIRDGRSEAPDYAPSGTWTTKNTF